MTRDVDEQRSMDEIIDRLATRFSRLPRARVVEVVQQVLGSLTSARVRDFVPVLVEREAVSVLKVEQREAEAREPTA